MDIAGLFSVSTVSPIVYRNNSMRCDACVTKKDHVNVAPIQQTQVYLPAV
jgi:hypothetical protein